MKINELTEAQFTRYFDARIGAGKMRKAGAAYSACCIFHKENTPSMMVRLDIGVFKCHGCQKSGGVIAFEKFYSNCDDATAIANIAEIVGEGQLKLGGSRAEAVYEYLDEQGKLHFQVLRYPKDPKTGKKNFSQRRPDGNGGWIYKTEDIRMVLYHLPEVIMAREVIICEGEKDVNRVRELLGLPPKTVINAADLTSESLVAPGVAVTSCPRGAGKWLDEYSPYLTGKKVLIFPDNDEPGRKHALHVAGSVYRYAAGVKIVTLPGLEEKGDVFDYLKTHTLVDLIAEANKAVLWRPQAIAGSIFVGAGAVGGMAPPEIDWMLEGIIAKGTNGMMIARPKAGKSFTILDMAVALASGGRWLQFYIPKRVRVAMVSREDHFGTTSWRFQKICQGRNMVPDDIEGHFYLNTRLQSKQLMLDEPEQLSELIRDLEKIQAEFLILDVFRRLHSAEENDNTDMQRVLDKVISIQEKVGCNIALIHHDNKKEDATLTERCRGASAILGWAEWVAGLKIVNPDAPKDEWIRELECEIKAAMPPNNTYFKIMDAILPDVGVVLERTTWTPEKKGRKKKTAEGIVGKDASAGEDETPF